MSTPADLEFDVVIVGAGPAGLCMALALQSMDLAVAVIDPAPGTQLAEAPFDGREIALTHASRRRLEQLGVWSRLPVSEVSALRDACIFNEDAEEPLRITHEDGAASQLGFLVPNHLIRRAAFAAFQASGRATLLDGVLVDGVARGRPWHRLQLADGRQVAARLVIAADGRFSQTRRAFGIAARMRDFGRSMLVCRMSLEREHDHVAWEWFGRTQTLALLPLNGQRAGVVITLPHTEIERLQHLSTAAFDEEVTVRYQGRLGAMRLTGERCVYPLVGVWPDRLTAPGFAAIGDAAVGMHPVTAHGFNLGLASVGSLAARMRIAGTHGGDVAADAVLEAYAREHRRASLPLYLATTAVVGLYTDTRAPARLARRMALDVASRLAPFRRRVARELTGLQPVLTAAVEPGGQVR